MLPGLPPYGPIPSAFPPEWGKLGREGTVVEFDTDVGRWVGNFRPGLGGLEFAGVHPNKTDALVITAGDLWIVDVVARTAVRKLPALEAMWDVQKPDGWVFSRHGIALVRLGPQGLAWHTRRLSWDGFDRVEIVHGELHGLAWSPVDDKWRPFSVDLTTGKSTGGSYFDDDRERWEILAE